MTLVVIAAGFEGSLALCLVSTLYDVLFPTLEDQVSDANPI